MTIIKIIVKSLKGELIKNATVNMIPTKDGIYTEQYNTGKNHFHVEANGYVGNDFDIDVHEEMQIEKDVILLEVNPKEKEDKVKETIINTIEPIVNAFIFNTPTDITSAKQVYKDLDKNIKAQKDIIEKALKDSVMDIFQAQATNLVYVAKSQLQPAMDYYVKERSKINPMKSWNNFRAWSEYTSMIAGIYLLRANLVKYLNTILEKLQEKI